MELQVKAVPQNTATSNMFLPVHYSTVRLLVSLHSLHHRQIHSHRLLSWTVGRHYMWHCTGWSYSSSTRMDIPITYHFGKQMCKQSMWMTYWLPAWCDFAITPFTINIPNFTIDAFPTSLPCSTTACHIALSVGSPSCPISAALPNTKKFHHCKQT